MSIFTQAKYRAVDAITFKTLILPGETPVFMNYTLGGGQTLYAGSVLGRITATGKLVLSTSAAGDGSQVPMAVLNQNVSTYDIDGTTALDTPMSVIVHGMLNSDALVFGTGQTIANCVEYLRDAGIHTRRPGYSG